MKETFPFHLSLTARLKECPEGGFSIQCVEIPAAISQGETPLQARENLQDAIMEVLKCYKEGKR